MERIVAIASDPFLAGILSLFLGEPGKFLAILEAPRLQRPDASSEVIERANTIRLASPSAVLLVALERDERDRMTAACEQLAPCIRLDTADDLLRYLHEMENVGGQQRRPHLRNPYIAQLLHRSTLPDTLLPIVEEARKNTSHSPANGIVCIEPGLSISAVAAANYAWAFGYSFRELGPAPDLTQDAVEDVVGRIDSAIAASASQATVETLIDEFKGRMSAAINTLDEWPEDVPLCFFTRAAPYGLLFPKNPTCHVLDLEAGLNTAMSAGWSTFERTHGSGPGYVTLFVDPQWPDITSETEDIIAGLRRAPVFVQAVTGAAATCEAFRLHANHFPYEILYVSSHGQAPSYRLCRHVFTAADGGEHEIHTHEFEYFTPHGQEIAVTQKTYPLSVDGVPWQDKERLAKSRGGEIFEEFILSKPGLRIPAEFKWIKNARVEGIALQDGVFFGPLYGLGAMGHPIVVLNCCSLWTSMAIQVMHARARAYIATLWSVDDASAVAYGIAFYEGIMRDTVINAARTASSAVRDRVSSSAYVCLSWPHARLREVDTGHSLTVKEVLADRLRRHFWGMVDKLNTSTIPSEVIVVLEFLATKLKELTATEGVGSERDDSRHSQMAGMDAKLRELRSRLSRR